MCITSIITWYKKLFDAEVYWKSYDDKFSIFVPQTTDSHITDSL